MHTCTSRRHDASLACVQPRRLPKRRVLSGFCCGLRRCCPARYLSSACAQVGHRPNLQWASTALQWVGTIGKWRCGSHNQARLIISSKHAIQCKEAQRALLLCPCHCSPVL